MRTNDIPADDAARPAHHVDAHLRAPMAYETFPVPGTAAGSPVALAVAATVPLLALAIVPPLVAGSLAGMAFAAYTLAPAAAVLWGAALLVELRSALPVGAATATRRSRRRRAARHSRPRATRCPPASRTGAA